MEHSNMNLALLFRMIHPQRSPTGSIFFIWKNDWIIFFKKLVGRYLTDIEKICRECEILNPPARKDHILPGEVRGVCVCVGKMCAHITTSFIWYISIRCVNE